VRAKEEFTDLQCSGAEIGALGNVAGLDVIELGCGTAYSRRGTKTGALPVM
jgi:hypothetical protein